MRYPYQNEFTFEIVSLIKCKSQSDYARFHHMTKTAFEMIAIVIKTTRKQQELNLDNATAKQQTNK